MTVDQSANHLVEVTVVIPLELALVVTPRPMPPLDQIVTAEDCIKVCATRNIPTGKLFTASEGHDRLDKLPNFPQLSLYDVRSDYGGVDDIDENSTRHCNWVRFIKYLSWYSPDVNIVSFRAAGADTTYLTIKEIVYGEQITVFFLAENYANISSMNHNLQRTIMQAATILNQYKYDVPLDLSQPSINRRLPLSKRSVCTAFESEDSDLYSHSDSSRSNSPVDVSGPPAKVKAINPYSRLQNINNFKMISLSNSFNPSYNHTNSQKIQATHNNCLRSTSTPLKSLSQKRREKSMLPCLTCGKSFDRPSLLKRHTRTHTGEKPHVCDVCSKGFSTSSSLNTHRRIHSGEKPHICPMCGKKFTASSNLYYHKMTHSKDKPHKCRLCTRSFPTPGDLKCHMYTHNGLWPFKCTVCQKGFSKSTNLRNHVQLHISKNINEANSLKLVDTAS